MTDISSPSQNFFRRLTQDGYAQNLPQSSVMENFDINVSMTMYEDMSNSRSRIMKEYQAHNIKTILKAVEEGVFPEDRFAGFRDSSSAGFNVPLATIYGKKHYGLDVKTDKEILENIREDLLLAKDRQTDVSRRAGMGGKVAGVVGSMIPYALDPVTIPTWFIGYGEAAAGVKFLAGFGKFMAANVAAESAAEVFRYGWKKDVSETTVADSIKSVAYATGVMGGLGVGAHLLGKGIKRFLRRGGFTPPDAEFRASTWYEHKLAQMAREMEAGSLTSKVKRAHVENEVDAVFEQFVKRGRPSTAAEAAQVFEEAGPTITEAVLKGVEKRDIQLLKKIHLAGVDDPTKEWVVAAAVRVEGGQPYTWINEAGKKVKGVTEDGQIFTGRTHYEAWKDLPSSIKLMDDDGFVTSTKRYLTREEARKFVGNRADEIDTAEILHRYGKEHQTPQRVKVESGKFPRVVLTDNSVHKIDFEKLSTSPWKYKRTVPLSSGEEADLSIVRTIINANGETVWSRPRVTPPTALEHAKALQAELEHQNTLHLKSQVRNVTQEPDLTKGSRDIPESLQAKPEGKAKVEPEVDTGPGSKKLEPQDVLDNHTEQVLKDKPDVEIPVGIEVVGGEKEVVMRKLSEVFKELDNKAELANKFKECLIG